MMEFDHDFLEWADAYLEERLDVDNMRAFEEFLSKNDDKMRLFEEHRNVVDGLKGYGKRISLKEEMNRIHNSLNLQNIVNDNLIRKPVIVRIWEKYKINSMIAASVAIIAVFTTLWLTGFYANDKNDSKYLALRRDMNNIRKNVKAQNALIKDINKIKGPEIGASHYGATGFALTSNGYLATTYHVIKDADSIYVQNNEGISYKVKIIFTDPDYDLAVLQIIDSNFKPLSALPYTFKQKSADIGEDVYTIGFPREESVYGRGYLSSNSGFGGDTVAYQVSIPVNPGNSGGPVLDTKGNIIGIINSKQTETDGAAFAIKSDFLLKTLLNIPEDSLDKKLIINKKNNLTGLSRTDQIKKVRDYIYMVKVY